MLLSWLKRALLQFQRRYRLISQFYSRPYVSEGVANQDKMGCMGYSELLMLLISLEIRKCENSLQLCTERLKHSTAETGRQMYFGLERVHGNMSPDDSLSTSHCDAMIKQNSDMNKSVHLQHEMFLTEPITVFVSG